MKNLVLPTIHLNGTSKDRLLEAIEEAYCALTVAESKLRETAPNGRDYYPQGADVIYRAQDQHFERLEKLQQVKEELQQIAEAISSEACIRCGKPITADDIARKNRDNQSIPSGKAKAFVDRYCADCAQKLPLLDIITEKTQ